MPFGPLNAAVQIFLLVLAPFSIFAYILKIGLTCSPVSWETFKKFCWTKIFPRVPITCYSASSEPTHRISTLATSEKPSKTTPPDDESDFLSPNVHRENRVQKIRTTKRGSKKYEDTEEDSDRRTSIDFRRAIRQPTGTRRIHSN